MLTRLARLTWLANVIFILYPLTETSLLTNQIREQRFSFSVKLVCVTLTVAFLFLSVFFFPTGVGIGVKPGGWWFSKLTPIVSH